MIKSDCSCDLCFWVLWLSGIALAKHAITIITFEFFFIPFLPLSCFFVLEKELSCCLATLRVVSILITELCLNCVAPDVDRSKIRSALNAINSWSICPGGFSNYNSHFLPACLLLIFHYPIKARTQNALVGGLNLVNPMSLMSQRQWDQSHSCQLTHHKAQVEGRLFLFSWTNLALVRLIKYLLLVGIIKNI